MRTLRKTPAAVVAVGGGVLVAVGGGNLVAVGVPPCPPPAAAAAHLAKPKQCP